MKTDHIMRVNFFQSASLFTKLVLVITIMFASFIFFTVLSFLLAIPLFHLQPMELMGILRDMGQLNEVRMLKYFQIAQSFGLFVFPPVVLSYLFSSGPGNYFGSSRWPGWQSVLLVVVLVLLSVPVINLLTTINSQMRFPESLAGGEHWMRSMEESAMKLTQLFLEVSSFSGFLVNVFMVALIPAIGEELVFRGLFQRMFGEMMKNELWGIILAALLFSAIHLQFYGFIPRFALGVLFGFLFAWSKTIWLPIIGHFMNNFSAVVLYTLIDDPEKVKQLEQSGSLVMQLAAAILASIAIIFIMQKIRKNYQESEA